MKDNVQGYEELSWIIEQSEDGLYVATATPRMQREIASHYSDADVCVYDYSTDVKPFTFSVPARLFRDNPDKRAYFLLNVQLSLLNDKSQFDDELLERLNFCRDMFAREKKNIVFFMTEEAARQLNLKAYDFHSYVRLFLDFEDDTPDDAQLIELPATLPDRSVGVAPPEIDWARPRNTLLAQAIALSNTARKYYDDGRFRDAETLARAALDIRTRLLGADSPDTAAAHYMLGMAEERLGRYDEAMASFRTALEIRKRTLGDHHPDTAVTIDRIATVYQDTGDYDSALKYFQKALEIYETVLGTDHPATAATYNNLAFVYQAMGDYSKALEYYEKVRVIRERTLGTKHPETAASYYRLGLVHCLMGNYFKALECSQKGLDIYRDAFGEGVPETADVYENLAVVFTTIGSAFTAIGDYVNAQNNYQHAIDLFQKVADIEEAVLGKEHPAIANKHLAIANARHRIADVRRDMEAQQKKP